MGNTPLTSQWCKCSFSAAPPGRGFPWSKRRFCCNGEKWVNGGVGADTRTGGGWWDTGPSCGGWGPAVILGRVPNHSLEIKTCGCRDGLRGGQAHSCVLPVPGDLRLLDSEKTCTPTLTHTHTNSPHTHTDACLHTHLLSDTHKKEQIFIGRQWHHLISKLTH